MDLPSECFKEQNPCSNKGDRCCNKTDLCKRIKNARENTKLLENVLDMASTLVNIMEIFGIHDCKANKALDVIIYSFMHFDEVSDHPGAKCKKKIRKEEFNNDLTRDCGMSKEDAKLTYTIVKFAFKAFYHKQNFIDYKPNFIDECEWKKTTKKTIELFTQSGGSKAEIDFAGKRITAIYDNFVTRFQTKGLESEEDVNTCICRGGKQKPPCGLPCPPAQPPLCATLQCQFECRPGFTCPQIICKDHCGRLFLRITGDTVLFDPVLMECEARRAAMDVCPPSNADRIKALRECLKICQPRDTDSCDDKLTEISKLEEEKEGEYEMQKEDGDEMKDETKEEDDKEESEVEAEAGGDGGKDLDEIEYEEDKEEGKEKRYEDEGGEGEGGGGGEGEGEGEGEEEGDGYGEGTIFFISAEFHTLKNGKRRLNIRVKGACPSAKKYISALTAMHLESSTNKEVWYKLTPTTSPDMQQANESSIKVTESANEPANEEEAKEE